MRLSTLSISTLSTGCVGLFVTLAAASAHAQDPQSLPAPVYAAPMAAGSGPTTLVVPAPAAPVAAVALQHPVLLWPSHVSLPTRGTFRVEDNELRLQGAPVKNSRRTGLLAGGITLLCVGYTPALITGSLSTLFGGPRLQGTGLLLPVLGPFLSGFAALADSTRSSNGLYGEQKSWAAGWMLLDGAAQVAGFAMILAGARLRVPGEPDRHNLQILPYASPGTAGMTLGGRF